MHSWSRRLRLQQINWKWKQEFIFTGRFVCATGTTKQGFISEQDYCTYSSVDNECVPFRLKIFTFIHESLNSKYVDSKDVNIIRAQSLPATNQKVLDNEIQKMILRMFRIIFHVRLVCNKKFYRNISALRQERLYRQGSTDECHWSWSWRRVQCKNGFIFFHLLI